MQLNTTTIIISLLLYVIIMTVQPFCHLPNKVLIDFEDL